MKSLIFAAITLAAAGAACFAADDSSSTDAGTDSGSSGLPCDVAQALSVCQACHGPTLAVGAPFSLITYSDLTMVSPQYSDQTVAQRVVARMGDPNIPMPPHPLDPSPQSDIDTIQAWIDASYPSGTCVPPAGGTDPFNTPSDVCTSGVTGTTNHSAEMDPGDTCITCHKMNPGAPQFTIAGTVYATAHEKLHCDGVNVSGAVVTLTDANNKVIKVAVNMTGSVGNFYSQTPMSAPYTVRLQYQGRERDMTGLVTAPTDGDCNSCHTMDGTNGAPGRIMLP